MENETYNEEEVQVEQKSQLHQVTPLSKYLALALFVILPFLGGWIGYSYAPEKIVEIERVVVKEVQVVNEISVPEEPTENQVILSFDPNTIKIGDRLGVFVLMSDDSVKVFDRQLRFSAIEPVVVTGRISVAWNDFFADVTVSFWPSAGTSEKIPQSEIIKNNEGIEHYSMGTLKSFPELKTAIEKLYSVDFDTDLNTIDSEDFYISESIQNINHSFNDSVIEFREVVFNIGRNGSEPWYVASAYLGEFGKIMVE